MGLNKYVLVYNGDWKGTHVITKYNNNRTTFLYRMWYDWMSHKWL